ncbi:nucleotidyltransferase family protein, partial [Hungatella hathewayi]
LLRMTAASVPFDQYLDVSSDLAARIRKDLLSFTTFEDRISALKTRQYTYTRISRALLHLLLGITDQEIMAARAADYAPYARVLGFNRKASAVLSDIKKRGTIPLITKTADAGSLLEGTAWEMFQKDLFCSHLYQAVVSGKYHTRLKNEYTHSVVMKS